MRALYSFLSLIVISPSLLCMHPTELILDIMLSNITHLSHDDIHSLALVNNNYNKIVKQTNNLRKNYVTEYALKQDPFFIKAPVTWHKNGAAYTYAMVELSTKYRTFKLVYLADNGVLQKTHNNFTASALLYPNSDHYHATFNGKGNAYFYQIDMVQAKPDSYASIMEYTLNTKDFIEINRCLIDLNDGCREHISCISLIHFPTLLQAFLKSTQIHKQATPSFSILQSSNNNHDVKEYAVNAKIYNIKGVTIPNDYNVYKEHPSVGIPFRSFDSYSTDITIKRVQNAVIKKYNEQQCKKTEQK